MSETLSHSGATFSACRTWRYALWRRWDSSKPAFIVIGLNPSTADELQDDPTIRRCINFAKREGCGSYVQPNVSLEIDPNGLQPTNFSGTVAKDGSSMSGVLNGSGFQNTALTFSRR